MNRKHRHFVLSAVDELIDINAGMVVHSDFLLDIVTSGPNPGVSIGTPIETTEAAEAASTATQRWVLCNQLGGGESTVIATSPETAHLRLIPRAGVAALIFSTATESSKQLDGRGYCFLPLPVCTQLPVHVNGYFELSSNRRDIWHGDDMAGGFIFTL